MSKSRKPLPHRHLLLGITLIAATGFPSHFMAQSNLDTIQLYCTQQHGITLEPDATFIDDITRMAASSDSTQRASAFSQLSAPAPIDAATLQTLLQAGMKDTNSVVRGQAVYAIAQQGCDDLAMVLGLALQDAELSVRLMALDSLIIDETTLALFKHIAENEEEAEAMRDLATMKLESWSAGNTASSTM